MFNAVLGPGQDITFLQEKKKFRPGAPTYGQALPDSQLAGEDPTPAAHLSVCTSHLLFSTGTDYCRYSRIQTTQIMMLVFASYTDTCFRIPPGNNKEKKCSFNRCYGD